MDFPAGTILNRLFIEGLQSMAIFSQVDPPALVVLIEGNLDVDAAITDIRIDLFYFHAWLVIVDKTLFPFTLPMSCFMSVRQ